MKCVLKFYKWNEDVTYGTPAKVVRKEYASFSSARAAATRIASNNRRKNLFSNEDEVYTGWSVERVDS